MAGAMPEHNLLTLDYWQDSVSYEGKTVPSGTIGCEALNISDVLREKLAQASQPLREIVQAIGENRLTEELLRPAKNSVLQMIQLTKDSLPFSRADPPITAVVWSIFFQMTASGIPLPMSKLPLQSV